MENTLLIIYNYFERKRKAFYLVFAATFLLIAYFALQVKFEEDISKIIPKDKKIGKMNEVFQNSKFIDKLVIMVSLNDPTAAAKPDSLVAFAGEFGAQVQSKLSPYIRKVNFKVDDGL